MGTGSQVRDIQAFAQMGDMDLSEVAVDNAAEDMNRVDVISWTLVVEERDAVTAGRLAERLGMCDVIVLPNLMVDSWCLIGHYKYYSHGRWSKGA